MWTFFSIMKCIACNKVLAGFLVFRNLYYLMTKESIISSDNEKISVAISY